MVSIESIEWYLSNGIYRYRDSSGMFIVILTNLKDYIIHKKKSRFFSYSGQGLKKNTIPLTLC